MPMISPTPGDVHVNRTLTNLSIAYFQDGQNYIADRVFPNVPVAKQADAYFTYEKGQWTQNQMRERAPATESAGSAYNIGNETYYARTKALHKDIPDLVLGNADNPINLEREASAFVDMQAMINREVNFAEKFFQPGVWAYNVKGAASATALASFNPIGDGTQGNNDVIKWSDAASTPIEDIRRGCTAVQQRTGYRPNKFVLSRLAYDVLVDHPDVIARLDRGQTTGPATANKDSLAALFELDAVEVMEASVNVNEDGEEDNIVFIGGNHAALVYSAPNPGLLTPSAGYTFSWTGLTGNTQWGYRVKRFRMEHLEVTRVEGQQSYDQKVIGNDLGYFFQDII